MTHVRMDRQHRAKQFMPFAALKGYEEAVRAKEHVVVPKKELTEDRKEELDYALNRAKPMDLVTVVYFCRGEYLKITGALTRIDREARYLKVIDTRIEFVDISTFEIEKSVSDYKGIC